jgi:hypothetical protein
MGLTTVTDAVCGAEISDAGMAAVTLDALTKVVGRGLPFQFTTEPDTNPVPFTVKVNPAPPGSTASGTRGWLIAGTGFAATATPVLASESTTRHPTTKHKVPTNGKHFLCDIDPPPILAIGASLAFG